MNICLIGTDIGPSIEGAFVRGHVNNIIRLSKEFERMGHMVHIITNIPKFSHPTFYEKWMNYTHVTYFPVVSTSLSGKGSEFAIKALNKVISTRSTNSFDILNVHSGFPILATLSALSKKISKLKTVHTLYSPFEYSFNNSIFDRVCLSSIITSLFSSLDKIIAISGNVRTSLISRHINQERITVIPPAVDMGFFNSNLDSRSVRLALDIDEKAPIVTYLGGFERSKGLTVLMRAIPRVVSEIPDVIFIVALNESPNDPYFNAFAMKIEKKDFSGNIRLIGITDKIATILGVCDIFVAPYLNTMGVADYPLAILEAMAMGKVVVASNIGGISEIINEKRGILIQPGNPTLLAQSIINLCNDKTKKNSLGSVASRFVATHFSAKVIAARTIETFSELLRYDN